MLLKRLSAYSYFGLSLDNMTKDRSIYGVRYTKIQQRLLAQTELSFEKALKIACAIEITEKNVCDIEEGSSGVEKMGELLNKLDGIWKEINKKGI